jgi:hypothetical protein
MKKRFPVHTSSTLRGVVDDAGLLYPDVWVSKFIWPVINIATKRPVPLPNYFQKDAQSRLGKPSLTLPKSTTASFEVIA